MRFLLFNLEGHGASGVGTFCRRLSDGDSSCYCVSLNMRGDYCSGEREICIIEEDSHHLGKVVSQVMERLQALDIVSNDWIICPNVGDVCFRAALKLKERMFEAGAQKVALLGICHSDDPNQYRVLKHYEEVLDGVMGVSAKIQEKLSKSIPNLRAKLLDYPLPVNLPEIRKSGGEGSLRLIYVGRLECEQKRIGRLPFVVEKLLQKKMDFELLMVGSGSEKSKLEMRIGEIGEEFEWRGWEFTGSVGLDRVLDHLGESDAIILVSDYEGTPVALLEALAMGVYPIYMEVNSMKGGLIEEYGSSVPQGDIEAMAEEIIALGRERDRLKKISLVGHKKVRVKHSLPSCAKQLVDAGAEALIVASERENRVSVTQIGYHKDGLDRLLNRILKERENNCFCVYGAGQLGRTLISQLGENDVSPELWVDSDEQKWGNTIEGIDIKSPNAILESECSLVAIASESFGREIKDYVEGIYEKQGKIPPSIFCI